MPAHGPRVADDPGLRTVIGPPVRFPGAVGICFFPAHEKSLSGLCSVISSSLYIFYSLSCPPPCLFLFEQTTPGVEVQYPLLPSVKLYAEAVRHRQENVGITTRIMLPDIGGYPARNARGHLTYRLHRPEPEPPNPAVPGKEDILPLVDKGVIEIPVLPVGELTAHELPGEEAVDRIGQLLRSDTASGKFGRSAQAALDTEGECKKYGK